MRKRPTSNATIRGTAYFGYIVTAWCNSCHHHVDLDMRALARRLGPEHGALHADLVPKLKCENCHSKKIGLIVGGYGQEHNEDAGMKTPPGGRLAERIE